MDTCTRASGEGSQMSSMHDVYLRGSEEACAYEIIKEEVKRLRNSKIHLLHLVKGNNQRKKTLLECLSSLQRTLQILPLPCSRQSGTLPWFAVAEPHHFAMYPNTERWVSRDVPREDWVSSCILLCNGNSSVGVPTPEHTFDSFFWTLIERYEETCLGPLWQALDGSLVLSPQQDGAVLNASLEANPLRSIRTNNSDSRTWSSSLPAYASSDAGTAVERFIQAAVAASSTPPVTASSLEWLRAYAPSQPALLKYLHRYDVISLNDYGTALVDFVSRSTAILHVAPGIRAFLRRVPSGGADNLPQHPLYRLQQVQTVAAYGAQSNGHHGDRTRKTGFSDVVPSPHHPETVEYAPILQCVQNMFASSADPPSSRANPLMCDVYVTVPEGLLRACAYQGCVLLIAASLCVYASPPPHIERDLRGGRMGGGAETPLLCMEEECMADAQLALMVPCPFRVPCRFDEPLDTRAPVVGEEGSDKATYTIRLTVRSTSNPRDVVWGNSSARFPQMGLLRPYVYIEMDKVVNEAGYAEAHLLDEAVAREKVSRSLLRVYAKNKRCRQVVGQWLPPRRAQDETLDFTLANEFPVLDTTEEVAFLSSFLTIHDAAIRNVRVGKVSGCVWAAFRASILDAWAHTDKVFQYEVQNDSSRKEN